ncbi:unnamed protein product, partial [Clavelina lepadiformis]
ALSRGVATMTNSPNKTAGIVSVNVKHWTLFGEKGFFEMKLSAVSTRLSMRCPSKTDRQLSEVKQCVRRPGDLSTLQHRSQCQDVPAADPLETQKIP